MNKTYYPTNLTEKQWQVIEKIVDNQKRKRKHSLRQIMNAIIYIVKTGCRWRMLPKCFAPWNSVYFCYGKRKKEDLTEELHDYRREYVRKKAGKEKSPGVGIIDSRSVKTSRHADTAVKGIDGGKKVTGRKQHIITDTTGFPLCVTVHAANIRDGKGAMSVTENLRYKCPRLVKIIADGGYRGEPMEKVKSAFGRIPEVVMRKDCRSEFTVLPERRIVERTFSWFENYGRWTIDYEFYTESSEATVQLTVINLMLNRIN
jgi:putative transposase